MSEIRFTATTYEKCSSELLAFRNANRPTQRDEAYFEWRYLERPNRLKPIIVWAESASGEKIGSLSLIPHHYLINNKCHNVGLLGDISLAKEYRGKGIAKQMFGYLSGLDEVKNLTACAVLPNDEAARPLEKSGWVNVSGLEKHVKVLSAVQFLEKKTGRTLAKIISQPVDILLRILSYDFFLKKPADYKVELVEKFDDRFDNLWNDLNKEGVVIGLRNRAYLTWRYANHPIEKYGIFTLARNSRLRSYIIFHIDRDVCLVDDFLTLPEDKSRIYLFYYFINHIRKNRLSWKIMINVNNNDLMGIKLRKFGFFRSPDFLNFMVLQNDSPCASNILLEGRKWFLTAGDKDV